MATLSDEGRLPDLLLSLKLTGAVSLSDRVAITSQIRDSVRGVLEAEVGAVTGGRRFDAIRAKVETDYGALRTSTGRSGTERLLPRIVRSKTARPLADHNRSIKTRAPDGWKWGRIRQAACTHVSVEADRYRWTAYLPHETIVEQLEAA